MSVLILFLALGPIVPQIPMAALVVMMVLVSFGTFDWHSIHPGPCGRMPLGETIVMVATVLVVVAADNLAIGVVVGCLTAMAFFARRVAHFVELTATADPEGG